MNKEQFSRTIGLIGEDNFSFIQSKRIFLAGLGGVGGTCFEALVRLGFKHFIIVDMDIVSLSNLNRQILYTASDLNKTKVEVSKARALTINDEVEIETYPQNIKDVLPFKDKVDFIIDCIDDVKAKVALIKYAKDNNIPIITSMGMANKTDPSKVTVASLNKSTADPLAKKMRYELKKEGVDVSSLPCVYSSEIPFKDGAKLNSIVTVTSTAGLYLANYVFHSIINNK